MAAVAAMVDARRNAASRLASLGPAGEASDMGPFAVRGGMEGGVRVVSCGDLS